MDLNGKLDYIFGWCVGEDFISVDGINKKGYWYNVHDKSTGELRDSCFADYGDVISNMRGNCYSWERISEEILQRMNSFGARQLIKVPT